MALAQHSPSATPAVPATAHRNPALAALITAIESACNGPTAAMPVSIMAALKTAANADLLAPAHLAARPERYARHVVYGDPAGRFTILSLVWGPGQFSPVHAHHAWCSYAVRRGTLEETAYMLDSAAMKARPLRTAARHAGYCCFDPAGPDQIHRLGNAGADTAMSIHVYGVGLEHIDTGVNRLVEAA